MDLEKKVGNGFFKRLRKKLIIYSLTTGLLAGGIGCASDDGNGNYIPVITSSAVTQINEGQAYKYDVEAKDEDANDTLEYSLIESPDWLSIDKNTGLISGTAPQVEADTDYPVKVGVSDGKDEGIQEWALTVKDVPEIPTNNAPVITSSAVTEVNEGEEYSYKMKATDVDENDALTFSLIEAPDWLSINPETREINGIAPEVDFNTSYPVTANVSDGKDLVTQSFDVRVKDLTIPEIITKSADRLIDLQSANGSWDWVVTDATGDTGVTYRNIAGVTAQGLLDAYKSTGDSKYLEAAKKTGDYFINIIDLSDMTQRHNSGNILFLYNLAKSSNETKYSDLAKNILENLLYEDNAWAHSYGNHCADDGIAGCTATELFEAIKEYRNYADQPIVGIVPWDLYKFVEAGQIAGEDVFANNIANIINDYINQEGFDNSIWWYDLGLAAGVMGLKNAGLDYSSILERLLSSQYEDGSFGYYFIQDTAYPLMALDAVGSIESKKKAALYLRDNFSYISGVDGSIINGWYDGDGEYSAINSEALQALYLATLIECVSN